MARLKYDNESSLQVQNRLETVCPTVRTLVTKNQLTQPMAQPTEIVEDKLTIPRSIYYDDSNQVNKTLAPPVEHRVAVTPPTMSEVASVLANPSADSAGDDKRLIQRSPLANLWIRLGGWPKVLAAVGLVIAMVSTFAVVRAQSSTVPAPTPVVSTDVSTPTVSEPSPATIMVHVLGAVNTPGVVSLPEGARVADAIAAAGGLTDQADPGELNLAAVVSDGAQIIIGTHDDPAGDVRIGTGGQSESSAGSASGLININTASQTELEELPGVGPVTASAIISWRETNDGFSSVAELQNVDGIGPKTFSKLEPLVCV
jgi:competence protein ComEA